MELFFCPEPPTVRVRAVARQNTDSKITDERLLNMHNAHHEDFNNCFGFKCSVDRMFKAFY